MGLWLWSLASFALAANAATVPVTGTVRDADSGAPLAHVVISVPGLHHDILTGDDGRYTFDAPPGTVRVVVRRFGYTAQSFDALVPDRGSLEVDIVLRRDPILLAPIEVTARASTTTGGLPPTFPDRSVSPDDVRVNPFTPEPDALRALGWAEVSVDPETPSGLHIRGGASDQVGYLLDGIPVFSPYRSGGTFGAWNPDALASIDIVAATPLHTAPEALSGVVSAHTRSPGSSFASRGSVSATQARAEIDGPLGRSGAGYLASVGSAFPGLALHNQEASHLNGDNLDGLAKLESPLFGGGVRVLGYGSRTTVDVSAVPETPDSVPAAAARHALAWNGYSFGAEWSRPLSDATSLLLRGWTASGSADVWWVGDGALEHLVSQRDDDGAVATLDVAALGGSTTIGVRAQRMTTDYALSSDSSDVSLHEVTPVTTGFVEHRRRLSPSVELDASLAAAYATAETYVSPSAQLRWRAARALVVSASVARRHQFAQSLRNTESVVSSVFPADLYLGAGGVPVATSDIAIVALEHTPRPWLRLGAQGYARDFEALALVAPREGGPFASSGFTTGNGVAHGVSLEARASSEHYLVLASYAYQRVQLQYAGDEYAPNYGASHAVQAGLVYTPSRSYSFRLGLQGLLGRRTTATSGSLEWESCNLIDSGCEFAGNPSQWAGELGGTELPSYFRLDLGVRREWDVHLAGYGGRMGLFGTATNLLGRRNVMTVTVDPATGQRSNLDSVPISPLVVGIDWNF